MTSHVRALRREDGGVIALVALTMPLLILFAAMVIDIGNWKGHDRKLQTRADAAALAAGVEYANNLRACITTPGTVGDQIRDKAKEFAGDPATGSTRNAGVNNQATVVVAINATDYNGTDYTDGGSPCADHPAGANDPISPDGGLWTDVKMTEANIPTFFGAFGIPLDQVKARARVQLQQITGVRERGLPFVNETGDQVECVWARFVRASDGAVNGGFTVSPSNPISLTESSPYNWSATNVSITLSNSQAEDIAVEYWFGAKDGAAPCQFDEDDGNQAPVPRRWGTSEEPTAVDWVNVFENDANPTANAAPKLRRFALTANTCGGPGVLYTADLAPSATCRVDFIADVDTGVNNVNGTLTVEVANDPDDRSSTSAPASVAVDWSTGTGTHTVTGTLTINPNTLASGSGTSDDFTQVGQIFLRAKYDQKSGRVGSKNCTAGNPCSGVFPGEDVDDQFGNSVTNVQHMTYMYDYLTTSPLLGAELSFENSMRGQVNQTRTFNINVKHTALDQDHIVIFRDSVQSSGNRTRAIQCGNGNGVPGIADAIVNGCAKTLVRNARNDSCNPGGSPTGPAGNPWDCIQLEQGNKSSLAKAMEDRFQCTANNWDAARLAGRYPPDADQRWAYIILTEYGRTFVAPNNAWLPIAGLLRVYVTGWDRQGGGGGPASCAENDDPPRGYDSKGAQIWGHVVEPITLDPDVITGDDKCDLSLQNIQCKPVLVR